MGNRKISVYLDKDTYDKFMIVCNKRNQSSYDVLRTLIKKIVDYK